MSAPLAGYDGRFDVAGWYLVRGVVRLKKTLGPSSPSLIDLGMGRGRDLIYFARHGFRVLGVDLSPVGLEKAKRRAARLKVPIRTRLEDIRTYRLKGKFDVVFSSCTLNHLLPKLRARRFDHFKGATARGGIHAVNVFIPKPNYSPSLDMDPTGSPYRPGELRGYYWDWHILDSREFEFDCTFSGVPHRHALDVVIARRPSRALDYAARENNSANG
ncbi:MAG: class I SAM-dependent methyltransferase [Thermoplasmata archaeon]|nr:class I SAM-dependent methyltransferase [Thermoplasmata archaeon]